MIVFDVVRVFRVFGGPSGLLLRLDALVPGHGLNYNMIQMWQRRATIPTKWMASVLYLAKQDGHDCAEFLIDDHDDPLGLEPSHARLGG